MPKSKSSDEPKFTVQIHTYVDGIRYDAEVEVFRDPSMPQDEAHMSSEFGAWPLKADRLRLTRAWAKQAGSETLRSCVRLDLENRAA